MAKFFIATSTLVAMVGLVAGTGHAGYALGGPSLGLLGLGHGGGGQLIENHGISVIPGGGKLMENHGVNVIPDVGLLQGKGLGGLGLAGLGLGGGYGGGHGADLGHGGGLGLALGGALGAGHGGYGGGYGGHAVPAAVLSHHDVKFYDVPSTGHITPTTIDVPANILPINFIFRSASSLIGVTHKHEGAKGSFKETASQDDAHILKHSVTKPIIQEIKEIISPYRKIVQEVEPVKEVIKTYVARGVGHGKYIGGLGGKEY